MSAVGIISQFLTPPIALCTHELVVGSPYTGGLHAFNRIRGLVTVDAMGIEWEIISAPPGYGVDVGPGANVFDREVLAIGVIHQLLGGTFITSELMQTDKTNGYLMFRESFPYIVDVLLSPGVQANFYWLLVL